MDEEIRIGDCITKKDSFSNMQSYFAQGPLKVVEIKDGPLYAGGKFIICEYGKGTQGFYLNAVKKVICS